MASLCDLMSFDVWFSDFSSISPIIHWKAIPFGRIVIHRLIHLSSMCFIFKSWAKISCTVAWDIRSPYKAIAISLILMPGWSVTVFLSFQYFHSLMRSLDCGKSWKSLRPSLNSLCQSYARVFDRHASPYAFCKILYAFMHGILLDTHQLICRSTATDLSLLYFIVIIAKYHQTSAAKILVDTHLWHSTFLHIYDI